MSQIRPNGQCIVDRGKRDQLQVDDRVVLSPRGGPTLAGRVTQVEGRTALVQLLDPRAQGRRRNARLRADSEVAPERGGEAGQA